MNYAAIILAGGYGTRLRSAVQNVPKPMAQINHYPFLHYQIKYLSMQGTRKIILAVGYKYESIKNYFKDLYLNVSIEYAIEESPLGTGGAFLNATNKLKPTEPFFALNGDTFFPINLSEINKFGVQADADIVLSVLKSTNSSRYMNIELEFDGKIKSLSSTNSQNLVNGGVYWINPKVIEKLNHRFKTLKNYSFEEDILPEINKLYGHEFNDDFIDIGIPEDYEKSKLLIPKHNIFNNLK